MRAFAPLELCVSGVPHSNPRFKLLLLLLLAEIYRIVSQRQIPGQPEPEFGPSTSIEPIRVLPTQQEGRQGPCCQNI